jgi:hypothetical protein
LDFSPALNKLDRPITIFVGHFGSGKTEIAVNLAFLWQSIGKEVTIVDLDLIKPYFRCRLLREDFKARVIRLVAPGGDKFYADLPILMPEARGILERSLDNNERVVIDLGGDDLGARVLGSVRDIVDKSRAHLLFVVNTMRPFAEDVDAIIKKIHDIETTAKMKVTGLIPNSHLMDETTLDVVAEGVELSKKVSEATSIPLFFCAIIKHLGTDIFQSGGIELPVLPIERHIMPPFSPPPKGFLRPPSVV